MRKLGLDTTECRLRGDRDETINPRISEHNKLAQKEHKTRRDWVGKVIHWELCKKLKFDHMNKSYMNNTASPRKWDHKNFSGILRWKQVP